MKKKIWVLEMLVRAYFAKKRTIEPHVIICSLRPIPRTIRSRKTRAPHVGALLKKLAHVISGLLRFIKIIRTEAARISHSSVRWGQVGDFPRI
jgi:hypothetical protein